MAMSRDHDEADVRAALASRYSGGRSKPDGSAVAARRAREKSALSPNDGRVKRGKGPRVQLNVMIRPEMKERLVNASRDHRLAIVEIVERGIEKALAELRSK
jgi:hypothetical protein